MGLLHLPQELLDHIIALFDTVPPSLTPDAQLPSRQLIEAADAPLKALSRTCRRLHGLCSGLLFRHRRFNASLFADTLLPDDSYSGVSDELDGVPTVYDPTALLDETLGQYEAFARTLPPAQSLLVYSLFETEREDRWHGATLFKRFWERLLDGGHDGAFTLTLIAPPMALARLTQLAIDTRDIWAFDMPFQRLRLACAGGWQTLRKHGEGPLDLQGTWSHLAYDEGSSLNLYGHYHYQDKLPPSILHRGSRSMRFVGSRLKVLTYTAAFPHYDSFRNFLLLLTMCDQLERLELKLAPEGSSPLLSDDRRIGQGSTSYRDCWNELERCYWDAELSVTSHMAGIARTPRHQRALPLNTVNLIDCCIPSMQDDFEARWRNEAALAGGLGAWERTMTGYYRFNPDWTLPVTDA